MCLPNKQIGELQKDLIASWKYTKFRSTNLGMMRSEWRTKVQWVD